MLYGNEAISNYTPSNISIWMALAFQGGVLNIGGFLACGRFVSHVTGFATYFGVEVSRKDYSSALGMLLVPLFFLIGAILSGILVDIRLKLHKRPKYYIVFGILFLLLLFIVISGFNELFGDFGGTVKVSDYGLLALLCLICGMQNGMITTVSKSVIRTTHLTGITTDLGIGIVRVLNRKRLDHQMDDEVRANLMRIGIIFFFGFGSLLGAFAFTRFAYRGFLLPLCITGFLFAATLYFDRSRTSSKRPII
jgi:uncharacterized membrane protein YoaK (UPF0700 family)